MKSAFLSGRFLATHFAHRYGSLERNLQQLQRPGAKLHFDRFIPSYHGVQEPHLPSFASVFDENTWECGDIPCSRDASGHPSDLIIFNNYSTGSLRWMHRFIVRGSRWRRHHCVAVSEREMTLA